MRLTSEYHMDCPCGTAIVVIDLGPVTCPKCGREAVVTFAPLTIAANAIVLNLRKLSCADSGGIQ
jgi:uncharacterized protein (UPF0212 family)